MDNDLRNSEYQPLQSLAAIGKRSLLIFNKIDLYPDTEKELILTKLRERVEDFIPSPDVIAIAAHPLTEFSPTSPTVSLFYLTRFR